MIPVVGTRTAEYTTPTAAWRGVSPESENHDPPKWLGSFRAPFKNQPGGGFPKKDTAKQLDHIKPLRMALSACGFSYHHGRGSIGHTMEPVAARPWLLHPQRFYHEATGGRHLRSADLGVSLRSKTGESLKHAEGSPT